MLTSDSNDIVYVKKMEMGSRQKTIAARYFEYPSKETSGILYTQLFKESLRLMLTGNIKLKPPLKLLDVGCGYGWVSEELSKTGFLMVAIEICLSKCRFVHSRFKTNSQDIMVVCCDGENLPFREGSFDSVIYYAALHHLPHPIQSLNESIRISKGIYILNEPRDVRSMRKIGRMIERLFTKSSKGAVAGKEYNSVMDEEMNRFDTKALVTYLEGKGFLISNKCFWLFVPPSLQNTENKVLITIWTCTIRFLNYVFPNLAHTFCLKAVYE